MYLTVKSTEWSDFLIPEDASKELIEKIKYIVNNSTDPFPIVDDLLRENGYKKGLEYHQTCCSEDIFPDSRQNGWVTAELKDEEDNTIAANGYVDIKDVLQHHKTRLYVKWDPKKGYFNFRTKCYQTQFSEECVILESEDIVGNKEFQPI